MWVINGIVLGLVVIAIPSVWPSFDELPASALLIYVPIGITARGFNWLLWGAPTPGHRLPRFMGLVVSVVAAFALFRIVSMLERPSSSRTLPNKPLQQANATASCSVPGPCRDAAGTHAASRGHGTLAGDLGVRC
jgi:hypothetical protein